jgi:hypothetical protein
MSLLPNLDEMTDNEKMAVLESIQKSISHSKEIQKQKIAANVDLVVQALKKIESDIRDRYDSLGNVIEKRVASIKDGKDGKNGQNGRDGKDGKAGRDGATGPRGVDGINGSNGTDGENGVSVVDAHIDFDGSLIIGLSSGRTINVGEVVAPDLAEKIKIISSGGGTSQYVLDTLISLQAQITALIPSQTGNSGKYLTTNGSALSWGSISGGLNYQGTWDASTNTPTLTSSIGVNGYYYITATAGSTNLNGITDWQIGDWLMFNGSVWQKIDQSNLVTSVAGRTGAITLTTADISALSTMSIQAANNVAITGGSITGITDLALADGGTGASTAVNARTNLGLVIGTDVLAPTGSAASLTSFPTFNQNTTGTAANVTGTVAAANGGTGQTSYAIGDLLYASASTTLSKLADVATGNAVISGGVTTAPSWGKIGLTTHVSGTLPTANGGTNLTSFTANGVTYASSTSALATGSALTFDGTNFATTGTATATKLIPTGTSVTGNGMYLPATNSVGISTAGTNAVYIDASQNVGLGVSSLSYKLELQGSVNTYFGQRIYNTNAGSSAVTYLQIGNDTNGATAQLGLNSSTNTTNYGGANGLYLSNGLSAAIAFATAGGERMRITGAGLVGIGTNAPLCQLAVGAGSLTDANVPVQINSVSSDIYFGANKNGGYGALFGYSTSAAAMLLKTVNAEPIVFFTANTTERMRISSAGDLLVGTNSYTTGKLVVQAKDAGYGGIQVVRFGGSAYWTQNVDSSDGYTWGKSGADFWYAGRSGSNNCVSSNGSWVNSSDERLKENIETLPNALSKVCSLRGVSFNRIASGHPEIGLIAQEVQAIYPDAVETGGDYLGLNYGALVGPLVEAIKEQQALITSLTARITALEAA